jgi:aspartate kinase
MPLPYLCTFNKQKMKVFKFGGASVSTVERIENMAGIIKEHSNEPLMIIVSAMGKTTNALEKVVEAFYEGRAEEALQLFGAVKQSHLTTAKYLLVTTYNNTLQVLVDFFTEVEWLLHDKPVKEFDYYYDQVVCIGELLSSCIVSAYMNEKGIANEWVDVRDVLKTDNNFREATVYWKDTKENLSKLKIGEDTSIYVTQGFIGSTYENESTTLGREGSDYTAAIFANLLSAESLTIWKDVEGVMSADPKEFPEATFISELSFNEVIEMAFYGAQVIHPKTIKPLQNKKIPLHVRSFINTSLPGTVISNKSVKNLPPIVIVKTKQVLVHLNSQDFSFVGEEPISELYKTFCQLHVKPNLIQTGAVTIQVCLDNRKDKIEQVAIAASEIFDVQIENALSLLTIRHYTDQLLDKMIDGKDVVLTQKTKDTVQVLYR